MYGSVWVSSGYSKVSCELVIRFLAAFDTVNLGVWCCNMCYDCYGSPPVGISDHWSYGMPLNAQCSGFGSRYFDNVSTFISWDINSKGIFGFMVSMGSLNSGYANVSCELMIKIVTIILMAHRSQDYIWLRVKINRDAAQMLILPGHFLVCNFQCVICAEKLCLLGLLLACNFECVICSCVDSYDGYCNLLFLVISSFSHCHCWGLSNMAYVCILFLELSNYSSY